MITNSTNASTGDDPVANISSGKIMRDANGNIFVAINYATSTTDNLIEYFKIIPPGPSSVVFTPPTPITLDATGSNPPRRGGYALDGNGRLYVIDYDGTALWHKYLFHRRQQLTRDRSHTYTNLLLVRLRPVMLAFANGVLVSNDPYIS
jgi:hypothetical protein